MKRILLDYLKRNRWIILCIPLYIGMTIGSIFFDSKEPGEINSDFFNSMFLITIFFGTMILSGPGRTLGFDRAVRILPLSSRQVGIGLWLCGVLPVPLVATATITLLFCLGSVLGTVSAEYFRSLPLIFVWGLMLSAVILDAIARGWPRGPTLLLVILDMGFPVLAYKYPPPILEAWAAFETRHVLILSFGGDRPGRASEKLYRKNCTPTRRQTRE